jgi:hypothetical protein
MCYVGDSLLSPYKLVVPLQACRGPYNFLKEVYVSEGQVA